MKPWQNEKQITAYIEQFNFTRREAKGFILADCLEGFESLSHLHAWNFDCKKCNVSKVVHCADTIKTLLYEHAGHNAKVLYIK